MVDKKDVIKDLKRVDNETDSVVDPNQYGFLGDFEFEDIIDNFGTWQEALNEAEISLRSKIAEDALRVKREIEGNLTQPNYRDKGNYPSTKIRKEYGSWNELKKSLGLDVHERNISDEDLAEDMRSVAEDLDHPLTVSDYERLGKYSAGIFMSRDFTFAEFRDKIGLKEPKKRGYPSKDALKAWYEEMKDAKGKFRVEELKERLSSTGYNYSSAYRSSLQDYFEEKGFQFSVTSSGGNGTRYYIKGPDAPSLEEYYQQFLDKIPDDKEDWFMELSGTGTSPKSIVAGIRYLTEDKTQEEIASEEDVSHITLRKSKNKIIERFDLDSDAGKDISNDENQNKNELSNEQIKDFFVSRNFNVLKSSKKSTPKVMFLSKGSNKVAVSIYSKSRAINGSLVEDCLEQSYNDIVDYNIIIAKNSFNTYARELEKKKNDLDLLTFDELNTYISDDDIEGGSKFLVINNLSNFDLRVREKKLAKKIAWESNVGNMESAIAAASIFISNLQYTNNLNRSEVSDKFGITTVTLRITEKNIREELNLDELAEEEQSKSKDVSNNSSRSESKATSPNISKYNKDNLHNENESKNFEVEEEKDETSETNLIAKKEDTRISTKKQNENEENSEEIESGFEGSAIEEYREENSRIKDKNQEKQIEEKTNINDENESAEGKGTEPTSKNVGSQDKDLYRNLFFNDFLSLLNYEILGVDEGKEFPIIFTSKNKKKILFVLELDQNKSNIDCVRAAKNLISSGDADKAVVISNSFFKISARNWAESKEKIELWNREDVAEKNKTKKSIPEKVPDDIKAP